MRNGRLSALQIGPEFPGRVGELREHLGLTQGDFSALFGREWKQVSQWERGEQKPRDSTLRRASKQQGWDVAIFEEGGPHPKEAVNSPVNRKPVAGVMVVGERRYDTPYGASVREAFDKMDLSQVPPEDIRSFAAVEVAEAVTQGHSMDAKRILWWIDQAYEAGRRSMQKLEEKKRQGAG